MKSFIEENNILHVCTSQYGFRQGHNNVFFYLAHIDFDMWFYILDTVSVDVFILVD